LGVLKKCAEGFQRAPVFNLGKLWVEAKELSTPPQPVLESLIA
jgi:hypothetical protein